MLTTLFGYSVIFFNCLFGQVRQNVPLEKTSSSLMINVEDYAFYEKTKEDIPLTAYETTTVVNVTMGNCISAVKDMVRDLEFLNSKEQKRRAQLTNNDWTVDYEFEALWPVSKSFEKGKIGLGENRIKKEAYLSVTIFLSALKENRKKSHTGYKVLHVFKDLGNNGVEVTTKVKIFPLAQAPNWLLNDFFLVEKANVLNELNKQTNCYY